MCKGFGMREKKDFDKKIKKKVMSKDAVMKEIYEAGGETQGGR